MPKDSGGASGGARQKGGEARQPHRKIEVDRPRGPRRNVPPGEEKPRPQKRRNINRT